MGFYRWLWVAAAIIVLDQFTKLWADVALPLGGSLELLPVLNLTLGYNTGAAFSLLGEGSGWQRWFLIAIAVGVSAYLLYWLRQIAAHSMLLASGLTLILAGAIGNLIDRVRFGYVIDFIHLYYQDWHWPIFNVADIAITLGVGFVLLALFRERKQP
ncbi:signal peptidase II [Halorhodospira abdelmalekii]|uniref:signal peptidase II n=1 Tax=Halorhodospira abdelmalekii TaxID=421629 RepID=UPI001905C197|nr:signal peptidase II [Halorhodospira abdelmalekii]MBK1735185.1 signal peptidase II [Halorhodospira abdelmalekii]